MVGYLEQELLILQQLVHGDIQPLQHVTDGLVGRSKHGGHDSAVCKAEQQDAGEAWLYWPGAGRVVWSRTLCNAAFWAPQLGAATYEAGVAVVL